MSDQFSQMTSHIFPSCIAGTENSISSNTCVFQMQYAVTTGVLLSNAENSTVFFWTSSSPEITLNPTYIIYIEKNAHINVPTLSPPKIFSD